MDCEHLLEQLPDMPVSARRVLCTLTASGPLTMKDIQTSSGLARRTVYGAVARLRDLGVVEARPNLRDMRQTLFRVTT